MTPSNEAFYVLLFLCPGYLGFRLYFIDKPWNALSAINVFYGSLVFSIFAYLAYVSSEYALTGTAPDLSRPAPFRYCLFAIPYAVIIALLWRRYGHKWLHACLIFLKITNEDNNATPWTHLFANPSLGVSQIDVYLKDGTVLSCDDTSFYDEKNLRKRGIFTYYTSPEGDIFFVANRYKTPTTKTWIPIPDIHVDEPWGVKLQWIPAREVARVQVRTVPVT